MPDLRFDMALDITRASTPPAAPRFTVYDAFGNNMTASPLGEGGSQGGSFRWRGGEGSVTDAEPNLVHMQSRHYDPTLGRFLQPDSLMLASFTTQGMNRYIYCENDPVNKSDPTGENPLLVFLIVLGLALAGVANGVNTMAAGGSFSSGFGIGVLGGAAALAIAALGPVFFSGSFLAAWLFAALGNGVGSLITAGLNGCNLAQRRRAFGLGLLLGLGVGWAGLQAEGLDAGNALDWLLLEVDMYWLSTALSDARAPRSPRPWACLPGRTRAGYEPLYV